MGFISNTVNGVRKYFRTDKERVAYNVAKSATNTPLSGDMHGFNEPYGNSALSDYLQLEADLLNKFADYEVMNEDPIVASALDIYSDDATSRDLYLKRSVWVTASDRRIQKILDDLFQKTLRIEEELWEITRNLCQYGSCLAGDTKIMTTKGTVDIKNIEGGEFVYVYNTTKFRFDVAPVRNLIHSGKKEVFEIKTVDKTIKATANHQFLVKSNHPMARVEWVAVRDLKPTMRLHVVTSLPLEVTPELISKYPTDVHPDTMPANDVQAIISITPVGVEETYDIAVLHPSHNFLANGIVAHNSFEEILITGNGVEGLNFMPSPTIRRVEGNRGELYGFIQTFNGQKTFTPYDLQSLLKTRQDLINPSTDAFTKETHNQNIVALEPFEVAHFRLKGGSGRKSVYGSCLRGDSKVWTSKGIEQISNIKKGDIVYTIKDGMLRTTEVLATVCSGNKEIFELKTNHRNIKLTANHPVLVNCKGRNTWTAVSDLKPNDKIVIALNLPESIPAPAFGLNLLDLKKEPNLKLPDFINEDIIRLLGFLLGAGYMTNDTICFATGICSELNNKYENILKSFGLETRQKNESLQVLCSSQKLVEIFRNLGWTDSAHNKRIPSWVYGVSKKLRIEFLNGFMDAVGGNTAIGKYMESCNKELVIDFKTLIDGLGWKTGQVTLRRKITKNESAHICNESDSYLLRYKEIFIKENSDFTSEKVLSVNPCGTDLTYDIQVENPEHNFIADGVVVHNSVLEPARWIWKRLVLLQDAAMIYRLQRAPERFAYYVDIGDNLAADSRAELRKFKQEFKKKKFINPTTNQLNLRMDLLPISHDTPVPLLDGRTLTIAEIEKEHREGKEIWVYSIDKNTSKVVPGKMTWVEKTRVNAEAVKITYADGNYAIMAPDHTVMMKDCTYVQAQNLKSGDAVMPLHRRYKQIINEKTDLTCEQIYNPFSDKFEWTHELMYTAPKLHTQSKDINISESKFNKNQNILSVEKVSNCDMYCMSVDEWRNLAIILRNESAQIVDNCGVFVHNSPDEDIFIPVRKGVEGAKVQVLTSPVWQAVDDIVYFQDQLFAGLKVPKAFLGQPEGAVRASLCLTGDTVVLLADGTEKTMKDLSEIYGVSGEFDVYSCDSKANIVSGRGLGCRVTRPNTEIWELELDNGYKIKGTPDHPFMMCDGSYKNLSDLKQNDSLMSLYRKTSDVIINHKVKSVKFVGYADCYDFTVPEFHNFAISDGENGGIFVHNSSLDVRFCRTVMRVQQEVINGLEKICRVHLSALNINPESVDFEVHLTPPSSVLELGQMEVRNAQAAFAQSMGAFVSQHWILSKIFNMPDSEIQSIMQQQEDDQERMMQTQLKAQMQGQMMQAQMMQQAGAAQQAPGDPNAPEQQQAAQQPSPFATGTGGQPQLFSSYSPSNGYGYLKKQITEKDLFNGNKMHEKAIENNLEEVLSSNRDLKNKLGKIQNTLNDMKARRIIKESK